MKKDTFNRYIPEKITITYSDSEVEKAFKNKNNLSYFIKDDIPRRMKEDFVLNYIKLNNLNYNELEETDIEYIEELFIYLYGNMVKDTIKDIMTKYNKN